VRSYPSLALPWGAGGGGGGGAGIMTPQKYKLLM
jgi:hypothetical protein